MSKPPGHAEMTPIENKLTGDSLKTYFTDYHRLWQRKCSLGLPPVRFFKLLFGQQDYCCQGKYRYWVWVHEGGRVLVSNTRGMMFEVPVETKTAEEALKIWKRFYRKTLKRIDEVHHKDIEEKAAAMCDGFMQRYIESQANTGEQRKDNEEEHQEDHEQDRNKSLSP